MKKLLYAFCTFLFPLLASGQAGIPQVGLSRDTTLPCGQTCVDIAARYLYTGNTDSYSVQPVAYLPLPYNTGAPILVNIDDTWSSMIRLPFSFCFFGRIFDSIIVGSNGCVSFDVSNANGFNTWTISGPLPANTPADLKASILGVWQDVDPTNKGRLYSEIAGTYPYRYYKISWDSVPYFGDTNSVNTSLYHGALWASYQIILYETTNMIDIYIRNKSTLPAWNGGLAVEGIVDPTSTRAYTVPGRNATQWTATNEGWRFTPNGPGNFVSVTLSQGNTIIDSAYGDTTQTLVRHVCPPSSPTSAVTTTYYASVTYDKCSGGTVTLYDSLHVTVPATAPGGSQTVCLNSSVNLAGCGSSSGTWTALPGNPSAVTIAGSSASGFSSTGVYLFSICSAVCDTVSVTVVPQYTTSTYATICGTQSYTFHGTAYSTAGTYTATLTSASACDTIASLYLSVVSADTTLLYDTICVGSTYAFGGQVLDSTGTYSQLLTSSGGCDSLVMLNLSVDTPVVPTISTSGNALVANPQGAALYLWYINNGGVPIAATDTFVPTLPGSYTVSVGSGINCLSTSQPWLVSGINEIPASHLSVYPNPSSGTFIIESSGLAGWDYTVTDMIGQVVSSGIIHQSKQQLDMTNADNGIYILTLGTKAIKLTVSK